MKKEMATYLRDKKDSRSAQALFLIFFLLVAGTIVAGFLASRKYEQVHRAEVEQQLAAVAELKVSRLEEYRKERMADATVLFNNDALAVLIRRCLQHPEDTASRQTLQGWLNTLQAHYQYDQVRFIDTGGATILTAPEELGPARRKIVKRLNEILQSGRPALSDFYRSDYDQQIRLALNIPIIDRQNNSQPLGLLCLRIDPARNLYPLLKRWPIPSQTAETQLIRREGQEVVFLNELRFRKNTALNLRLPLKNTELASIKAALGQHGLTTARDYRGARVLADVRAVPDSPWYLVNKIDESEAYARVREALWALSGLIFLLVSSLGMALSLLWQRKRVSFYKKQHQTMAALTEAETRYQHLYESMTDAFAQTTMDGKIVNANRSFLEMVGYSREEALRLSYQELTPERWHAMEGELIESQVLPSGSSELYEKEYIRKDGTILPVELRTYLLHDDQGQPSGMWAIIRDISERKEAERKLSNLNRVYAVSSKISQAAIHIDQPLELFQQACRIVVEDGGFPMAWISRFDEESGRVLPVARAGRDDGFVERLCTDMNSTLQGRMPTSEAIRTARHILCNDIAQDEDMKPWRDEALTRGYRSSASFPLTVFGKVRGTISMYAEEPYFFNNDETRLLDELARNLSHAIEFSEQEQARQKAEAALLDSQQLFSTVTNTSPALIWMSGLDQGCIWFNMPWLDFTGRSLDEELGEGWTAGVHPEDLTHCLKVYSEAFEARQPFAMEYRLRRHDGEYRWLLDQGQPRYDSVGDFAGYIGSCLDITDHRTLEKQLRHAAKMESVGTLAGGVAHDFNNILMAIIGYGQLSLMAMPPDDPQRANIENILQGAHRAARLTKDLLLFSRKQVSERTPVDLGEIIGTVKKFIVRVIGEDIACEIQLPDHRLTILADSYQLEQVLMNLATNARDAMPKGGTFSITAKETSLNGNFIAAHGFGRPGSYALLTVADSGCGMNEETRSRIFEPFFTTKEVGKGTGLGLAMVYGIIKQHDGYINVYSEPDKGTTFRIYLPLTTTPEATEEKITAAEETPARGTETILLAEDDEFVRILARTTLKRFGYTVIEAVDGEEAVRKFEENPTGIDLFLSDIIMPKMNGREAYEAIRKVRPETKVIFMSGYAPDVIREKATLAESVPLLAKPLSPTELLRMVRETLDQ